MPLSAWALGSEFEDNPADFFKRELPSRTPPGKFRVVGGRKYIARTEKAGALVIFHWDGAVVAHARLQANWYLERDPSDPPDVVCSYLLESIIWLSEPLKLAELPTAWQEQWEKGRFDQYPRLLSEADEQAFLDAAR
jgi:hypothetical protein